jgi:signal transduction histidine kinase
MRSIAVKLWVMMVVLMVLVLGTLAVIQTKAIEVNYYRSEAQQMIREARELSLLLSSGASLLDVSQRVNFLSQLFRANVLIIDDCGRVCSPYGLRGQGRGRVYPGMPVTGEDVEAVLSGKTISRQGKHPLFEGFRFLWVGTPVMDGDHASGGVFVYAPVESINARVRGLEMALLGALVAGAALAGVLSYFIARQFSRPLVAMEKAAGAMAAGNYAARVAVHGEDEVACLGQSFNRLAAELEKRITALERMDQTRREFVAAASHEMRTPLSIIKGYTEAILEGMATEEEKAEYLTAIHEESERLRRLADELLDLRRMETGTLNVRREEVSLGEIAARAAARFKARAAEGSVDFQVELVPAPPVTGDPDRLEQVVLNLLDNAFRFTPPKGSVTLALKPVAGGVELRVSDTGPGISPEDLPYIWEKFYRVDPARARDTGGSGLGLAIVRQIVELHGGRVEVSSTPGEGSTFTVVLPAEN